MRRRNVRAYGVLIFFSLAAVTLWLRSYRSGAALITADEQALSPRASLRQEASRSESTTTADVLEEEISKQIISITASKDMEELILHKIQLESLLRANANLTSRLTEVVASDTTPARARLALIHTLGAIPTAEAEDLLLQYSRKTSLPQSVRTQAIVTLAERPKLSQHAIAEMWRVAEDTSNSELANAALLNLGVAAATLTASESESAELIVQQLLTRAADQIQAPHSAQFALTIDALGNTGSAKILPLALSMLESPTPLLRTLGVSSLRRVPGEEAENNILNAIAHDSAASTRTAAVEALHAREVTKRSVEQIAALIEDESDQSTRREMIRYLGSRIGKYSVAKEALLGLLTREDDQTNYSMVVKYLSQ